MQTIRIILENVENSDANPTDYTKSLCITLDIANSILLNKYFKNSTHNNVFTYF